MTDTALHQTDKPDNQTAARGAPRSRLSWIITGMLIGALATGPLMGLIYLSDQIMGLPMLPFDLFDWLARTLPGDVITQGIDTIVDLINEFDLGETSSTAKTLETIGAIAQFFGIGVVGGVIIAGLAHRARPERQTGFLGRFWPGIVVGLALSVPVLLISLDVNVTADAPDDLTVLWGVILFLAWGLAANWLYILWVAPREDEVMTGEPGAAVPTMSNGEPVRTVQLSRRQFLIQVGAASATLTVAGAAVARYLEWEDERDYQRLIERRREQASAIADELPNAGDPVQPAPGTRPELTPLDDHYRIDINVRPPEIDAADWTLTVNGLVDNPMTLTIDDLRDGYDPMHQYVTLACISNRVGGDLTSTILWTGISLQDLLRDAGVQRDAAYLKITAEDGFYETVALELVNSDERVMLAYNWEGIPLLHKHGYPLRIYIPDRYGMKQPKWITGIELIPEDEDGYWVTRGWSKEAIMRTTSVVDVAASDMTFEQDGTTYVPVGGIAHAGARGISKVEVRVDEGEWVEAQLRSPLSETTWVIWRYDWPFDAGEHTFEVRAYDGTGELQVTERNSPRPDGATGIHSLTREI